MKNNGFIAFLIDSFISFLLAIIFMILFHKLYNISSNIWKIILLLATLAILPLCLGIIIASISGKKTLGRIIVLRNQKDNKKKVFSQIFR